MTSRYIYFISKSSTVIYKLCIGKGTAKERLIECEEKIKNNLFYSGFRSSTEIGKASLAKSLYGKRNSTASKFIKDIYDLHAEVKSFIDYPDNE